MCRFLEEDAIHLEDQSISMNLEVLLLFDTSREEMVID